MLNISSPIADGRMPFPVNHGPSSDNTLLKVSSVLVDGCSAFPINGSCYFSVPDLIDFHILFLPTSPLERGRILYLERKFWAQFCAGI